MDCESHGGESGSECSCSRGRFGERLDGRFSDTLERGNFCSRATPWVGAPGVSVTAALPERQIVFSPVEPEVELAGLCLQVAQTLSQERLKDVALATDVKFPADACTLPLKQLANEVQRHLWLFKPGECGGNRNSESSVFAFLAELRAQFHYSIVATAAVCDSAAAIETAQFSDGVVLVIRAHSTKRVAALKAKRLLEEARARVLGAILVDREFPIPEILYRRL